MNGLTLHCGAHLVDRAKVDAVNTPLPTATHFPIPHSLLIDEFQGKLADAGLTVTEAAHGLTKKGDRYFGLFQLQNGQTNGEHGLLAGLRNAHDKAFRASLAIGARVWICDNLIFTGEVVVGRKHTRFIKDDLRRVVVAALQQLGAFRVATEKRIACYKDTPIGNSRANDIIIDALDAKVIGCQAIPKVLNEWRMGDGSASSQHEDFEPRNAWSLYNAFTQVAKGTGAVNQMKASRPLNGVFDGACGLVIDGSFTN